MEEVEAGVSQPYEEEYVEADPRTPIELNKDFYQPSYEFGKLSKAVQKDLVLGNIDKKSELVITARLRLIDAILAGKSRNPEKWIKLDDTVRDEYRAIADMVTVGRGRDGFTAKILRSTFAETQSTIRQIAAVDKRKATMKEKIGNLFRV